MNELHAIPYRTIRKNRLIIPLLPHDKPPRLPDNLCRCEAAEWMVNMFNSEFCNVEYRSSDNAVIVAWKKFCCHDDYRTPVKYALKLMQENPVSNFIIDARNGFEDDPADVQWGFTEFIPSLSLTECKHIVFIMKEVTEIEDEMDMWSKEFGKKFNVLRVNSYETAVEKLSLMDKKIFLNVTYTLKENERDNFYSELCQNEIALKTRKEYGNLRYDYYYSKDNDNIIILNEIWIDTKSQINHTKQPHFMTLKNLKLQYVIDTKIETYYF